LKKELVVVVIVLFLGISIIPGVIGDNPSFGKTITVDDDGNADYTRIQDAIDNASDGDTVFVYNGTYYENIVVSKHLLLKGENVENTIVEAGASDSGSVIRIASSNVTIINFTIAAYHRWCSGMEINGGDNCCVQGNVFYHKYNKNNAVGVSIIGDNNIIQNNEITNFYWCVRIMDSQKNNIFYNNFYNYSAFFSITQSFHLQKLSHISRFIIGNNFNGNFYNSSRLFPAPLLRWIIFRDADPSYPNPLPLAIPLLIDLQST
jgi:hypothetical protein